MKIKLKEIRISRIHIIGLVILLNTFNLPAQNKAEPLLKAGIVSDVQYADIDNNGSRYYRSSIRKFEEAVQRFQEENVDFVVILGDFIDNDFKSYNPLKSIIKGINIPVYFVLGNHDFSVKRRMKKKIPEILNLKNRYYSIIRNNWRFIFLDGTDLSIYSRKRTSSEFKVAQSILDSLKRTGAPNAFEWNGGIGTKQYNWLDHQLNLSEESGENIVVLCHFPVFPENEAENLWNAHQIKYLMESYKEKIVFINGHTHRSNINFNNDIFYVSLRGMVEEDENSFTIAEIFDDSILIKGFGAEKSVRISW